MDEQGNIIAGLSVLGPQGRLVREIPTDSILDSGLQKKFASLTRIKGSTQHYYGAMEQASAGDRIVFTLGWDTAERRVPSAGVVVYDVRLGRAITSFSSTFPVAGVYADTGPDGPMLHLTPDGRRIIIEQYDWRPSGETPRMPSEDPGRLHRFRTGTIALYDADTGVLSGKVTLDPVPHYQMTGGVINFSNDSRYLYYWFDEHLYVIDLENNRVASKLTLPDRFDPVAVVSRE
jgi:hypothetical protein